MTDLLTICCEPLKMLTVSLCPSKTSLKSASSYILLIVPRQYFLLFYVLVLNFCAVCTLHAFSFLVSCR